MPFFSKPKPVPPPQVPTDQVIPLHYFDGQDSIRGFLLDFTLCFDDVLDPTMLQKSLGRLLEIEGWRKLGGRYRLNAQGRLEYHIPKTFDEKRPGFIFSHTNYDQSVDEHPLASTLPRAKSTPTVFRDPKDFRDLVRRSNAPVKMDDWLYNDHPPLSLHVVSFSDATLVTISFSHTLLDGSAIQILLKAWIAVLNGEEHQLSKFVGFEEDPINLVDGKTPGDEHVLYSLMLTGVWFLLFVVNVIIELLLHPKEEGRVIQIPRECVQALQDQAVKEIQTEYPNIAQPFVSEGDVLLTWWSRVTATALRLSPRTPVSMMNIFDIRGAVGYALPPSTAFPGNAVLPCQTWLTVEELQRRSLGSMALQIRQALQQQRTYKQIEAYVSLHKDVTGRRGKPLLFGKWNMVLITWSNLRKAKFFDLDFSAAVTKSGGTAHQRPTKPGRPSYINMTGYANGFDLRNTGTLLGQDAAGNWWLSRNLRASAWPAVQREVENLAKLQSM